MKWRLENKIDYYDTLVKWWKEHDFPVLTLKNLPTNIFVAYNDEMDICAIPLYRSDSDFCYLGFITMNKKASIKDKGHCVPYLTRIISYFAKDNGYDRLMITCNVSGLQKQLVKSDFEMIDKTNYYLKNL